MKSAKPATFAPESKHRKLWVRACGRRLTATISIHVEGDDRLGAKAADLLGRYLTERTGLAVRRVPANAAHILLDISPELPPESLRIESLPAGGVRLSGGDGRGLIYAVGCFLRRSLLETGCLGLTAWRGTDIPDRPWRGMYFATHFHNFYHDAPLAKVVRYIEELALYGCNTLNVWFDLHHYPGIGDPAAQAMIRRLRALLEAARSVGIGAGLTTLANEGWSSTPEALKASNAMNADYFQSPGGFYHTEICPSLPGGLELILRNREEVLAAFSGMDFSNVWIWPYDQGGCTCTACKPWGANGFLRAAEAEAGLIRHHFPKVRIVLSTWYFDHFIKGEWEAFELRLRAERPPWIDLLMADDFCGFSEWPRRHGIPLGLPTVGFPEISMCGNHPWGGYGALPRPRHWEEYWRDAGHLQCGNFPYSEGIFEDFSKFILLQLNRQPDRAVEDIMTEYIAGHFGAESVADVIRACYLMEQDQGTNNWSSRENPDRIFNNPTEWPQAEKAAALMEVADARLPADIRASWRWRLLYLRALIDRELKRTGGRHNAALDGWFRELATIYHATPGISEESVTPPMRA